MRKIQFRSSIKEGGYDAIGIGGGMQKYLPYTLAYSWKYQV